MSDPLADRLIGNQIDNIRNDVARDAERLAETVQAFAASIVRGGLTAGDAGRIAQDALRLVQRAERLDAMREVAAVYTGNPQV